MSVLVDSQTRVLVQGITGHQGTVHTRQMRQFGTRVVAGVTPGKGGGQIEEVPVFDSVQEAVDRTQANASVIFVPAPFAKDALIEAVDAGITLSVVVTEHIPFHDMLVMYHYSRLRGARIIGPNCPGIAAPGKAKVGIIPNVVFAPGRVGVISRSGTLTYEIVNGIKEVGLGQSTCIGLGGDPVVGTNFVDALPLFEKDPETDVIVMVGEIGGTAEEEAAEYIHGNVRKPVVAYVAGSSAPPGKRMGHAGAIIARGRGTAESKRLALERAGATVARFPYEIPLLVAERVKGATRR
ncbi:MAG: succinate--CoA ligase subunit alpha [Thermoplasmata archaeon]